MLHPAIATLLALASLAMGAALLLGWVVIDRPLPHLRELVSTEATIEQNDKTITISRATPNMGEFKSVFNPDGTETYASVDVGGQQIPLTLKARWENGKLITSTWANVGQMIEIILNLSLDAKGNLVTEHVMPAMGNGMNGGTLVSKYKKN